jgi:hypothetical protein
MIDDAGQAESLLPYAQWSEEALRSVVADALDYAARHGLPGEHHFYLTFRTDFPGVTIPAHLKARYPQEMTIVLQHRFWDLKVDRTERLFSVGLSFGGVPAMLTVPFAAMTAFADPQVKFGLRFAGPTEAAAPEPADATASAPAAPSGSSAGEAAAETPASPQVVSLDAFRRRPSRD